MNLVYRDSPLDDLQVDECVVRYAGQAGKRWPMLWFRVLRETDGVAADFAVLINPGGSYIENGAGGKTWGFVRVADGTWQVSPSINVLASQVLHPGEHPTEKSIWHQTPTIVSVPEPEPWRS